MTAPDTIYQLVEKFKKGAQQYTHKDYNETQVRVEFVNPFFEALGWDVRNSAQVTHEDRVIVDEDGKRKPKHPDYGFRIGNTTHFYVETKKPALNLKNDPSPAFQVRRYGWSGNLPLSILTDFEEFIIYDCRIKPDQADPANKARLRYYDYGDYVDKWSEIESILSHQAVQDGALTTWIEDEKTRGALSVDEAFLREMEGWREILAMDIALHNRDLTQRQLNILVQRTIDRIVFLRIAEDRNIEAYGRLQRAAGLGKNVYQELKILFNEADDKYNSGLFHFDSKAKDRGDADTIAMESTISDDPLRKIISNLYYPNSPYEFSVLPADILGQVYERFLGKVIELSAGGKAKIEEKPEVRKAGGVYYTPTYIVDYIVDNTVGKLVEGKTPAQVEKLSILDPACGSGSFLIGAYQFLMDWHLAYYRDRLAENPNSTFKNRVRVIPDDPAGGYTLTTDEKRRILINNIYGVDLDQSAVEVTKLSLLLKMLENETSQTTQTVMFNTGERILPDLDHNIKWGNSLIGSDFYSGKQLGMFDDEEMYKVKAFDWDSKSKGFGEIMADGGFDAVIGNPPYIRIQTMKETAPETVPFYKQKYVSASKGNYDIYVVFVEKGLQLLNPEGLLGFILPHKFFNAKYGEPLRGLIGEGQNLAHIVNFGDEQVFNGATTYTCLLFLLKSTQSEFTYIDVTNLSEWRLSHLANKGNISMSFVGSQEWVFIVDKDAPLFYRLKGSTTTLGDISDRIFQGLVTSADSVYLLDPVNDDVSDDLIEVYSNQTEKSYILEKSAVWFLCKGSRDVSRYFANPSKRVLFPYDPIKSAKTNSTIIIAPTEFERNHPNTWQYLLENKVVLENRERGKMKTDKWYGYVYPKSVAYFGKMKILTPSIANQASFTLDKHGEMYFVGSGGGGGGGYGIILNDEYQLSYQYVLGLLNSKLLDFMLKKVSSQFKGGYYAYNRQYIEQLPIRTIDFDNPDEVQQHDHMVRLVERMLDLHKQLPDLQGVQREMLDSQIEHTDAEIDALVYQLYGLTDDEIKIVEGN